MKHLFRALLLLIGMVSSSSFAAEELPASQLVIPAKLPLPGDFMGFGFDSLWIMSGGQLWRVASTDNSMTGIKLQSIPYKGAAPAIADMIGGQVAFVFDNVIAMAPLAKTGKVRCLAVSTQARTPLAPEVPTMAEAGVPGYVADVWFGLFAPAGTPPAVIERLNAETNRALKQGVKNRRLHRFLQEPEGTQVVHDGYRVADIAKTGQDNRRRQIAAVQESSQKLSPVHYGHEQVRYDGVERRRSKFFERFFTVLRGLRDVPNCRNHP